MNYLVVALRLAHIVFGVFWVGSSLLVNLFVAPAIAATGEAGQKFMGHLVTKSKISMRISIAAILTVLAGSWLYIIDSGGPGSAWSSSGPGWGFGLGGLFAIIGLGFGIMVGVFNQRLGTLASEMQGKPSQEQLDHINVLRQRLSVVGPISTIALILALICMATARYWVF